MSIPLRLQLPLQWLNLNEYDMMVLWIPRRSFNTEPRIDANLIVTTIYSEECNISKAHLYNMELSSHFKPTLSWQMSIPLSLQLPLQWLCFHGTNESRPK